MLMLLTFALVADGAAISALYSGEKCNFSQSSAGMALGWLTRVSILSDVEWQPLNFPMALHSFSYCQNDGLLLDALHVVPQWATMSAVEKLHRDMLASPYLSAYNPTIQKLRSLVDKIYEKVKNFHKE